MLTKQYRKAIGSALCDVELNYTTITGNVGSVMPGTIRMCFNYTREDQKGVYNQLILGTDDTPPTEDDCLWSNGVELTRLGSTNACASDTYIYNLTETFQNNTGESVTIKEIGLTTTGNAGPVLLGRLVLENPITIANGETYSFHYTIC